MNVEWSTLLIPLAPFAVLALFVWLSLRRSADDRAEIVKFGRKNNENADSIAAALQENNALLRQMIERLDRLEQRERR